jgi:multisubunit Na+/H+ antiporter MnhE subunit
MPPRPPRARNGPPIARLGFALAWAAGSMLLWMLLTSTVRGSELVAGAIAAVVTAVAVEAVRERERFLFRPRLRWLRPAVRLPLLVVTESWRVTGALVRHLTGRRRVRGAFVAVPFEHGPTTDPEAAARRALLTAGLSVAPNTVVVGIDERRGEVLVHQLLPDPHGVRRAMVGR